MTKDYEKFIEIVLNKLSGIYSGRITNISFQVYGLSAEQVRKYWRKARRQYSLPRAKRIEQATISF